MKYILKRILVGVAIGTILMLIRSNVFAKNIDITDMFYQNCRAVYDNNGTLAGVYGNPTLTGQPTANYTYCKSNNFGGNTTYSYVQYFISKSLLGSDAPVMEQNKSYNFDFNIRTSFLVFSGNNQQGPNNLTKVVFGIYNDVNSSYNSICNIEKLNDTMQEDHIIFHNYKVSCKNVTMGTYTSYTYLRLYAFIDSDTTSGFNMPDLIEINNIMGFEENVTQATINDSITNPNISGDFSGIIPDTNEEQNLLGDLVFIPFNFFKNIVDGLTYQCSPINMGSLFGVNITFPCLTPSTFIGTAVWGLFDILITSVGMIAFANRLKAIFNDFLTLGTGAFKRSFEIFGIFSE